jgi:hypothetical protein
MDAKGVTKIPRRQLVQAAAAKLRDLILARKPGTQIGSLNEGASRREARTGRGLLRHATG